VKLVGSFPRECSPIHPEWHALGKVTRPVKIYISLYDVVFYFYPFGLNQLTFRIPPLYWIVDFFLIIEIIKDTPYLHVTRPF